VRLLLRPGQLLTLVADDGTELEVPAEICKFDYKPGDGLDRWHENGDVAPVVLRLTLPVFVGDTVTVDEAIDELREMAA
jgi:hypothetical protein